MGQKISELPVATSLIGNELVPLVQDGHTRRATVEELRGEALQFLSRTVTLTSNTATLEESDLAPSLVIEGTLTALGILNLPDEVRGTFLIQNRTTGGFGVRVQTSSGNKVIVNEIGSVAVVEEGVIGLWLQEGTQLIYPLPNPGGVSFRKFYPDGWTFGDTVTLPSSSGASFESVSAGGDVASAGRFRNASHNHTFLDNVSSFPVVVGASSSSLEGESIELARDVVQRPGKSLRTQGGLSLGADSAQAVATTLTDAHYALYFDTSGGNITQPLPDAVGLDGREHLFYKVSGDTNTLTITPPVGQGESVVLRNQDESARFRAFSGKWRREGEDARLDNSLSVDLTSNEASIAADEIEGKNTLFLTGTPTSDSTVTLPNETRGTFTIINQLNSSHNPTVKTQNGSGIIVSWLQSALVHVTSTGVALMGPTMGALVVANTPVWNFSTGSPANALIAVDSDSQGLTVHKVANGSLAGQRAFSIMPSGLFFNGGGGGNFWKTNGGQFVFYPGLTFQIINRDWQENDSVCLSVDKENVVHLAATTVNGASGHSSLHSSGSIALGSNTARTTAVALDETHYALYFDTSEGNITQPLPDAVGLDGREYLFYKTSDDANTLTIAPFLGQGEHIILRRQDSGVRFRAFGGKWRSGFSYLIDSENTWAQPQIVQTGGAGAKKIFQGIEMPNLRRIGFYADEDRGEGGIKATSILAMEAFKDSGFYFKHQNSDGSTASYLRFQHLDGRPTLRGFPILRIGESSGDAVDFTAKLCLPQTSAIYGSDNQGTYTRLVFKDGTNSCGFRNEGAGGSTFYGTTDAQNIDPVHITTRGTSRISITANGKIALAKDSAPHSSVHSAGTLALGGNFSTSTPVDLSTIEAYIIYYDTEANSITQTLPDATGLDGREYVLLKASSDTNPLNIVSLPYQGQVNSEISPQGGGIRVRAYEGIWREIEEIKPSALHLHGTGDGTLPGQGGFRWFNHPDEGVNELTSSYFVGASNTAKKIYFGHGTYGHLTALNFAHTDTFEGLPNLVLDAGKKILVHHTGSVVADTHLNGVELDYERKVGFYTEPSGYEGGVKADSVLNLKAYNGINFYPATPGNSTHVGLSMVDNVPTLFGSESQLGLGYDVNHTTKVKGPLVSDASLRLGNDTTITTSTTLGAEHHAVYYDTSAGNITQLLPDATGLDGRSYLFIHASHTNTLTIAPEMGQGDAVELHNLNECVLFRAYGGVWRCVSLSRPALNGIHLNQYNYVQFPLPIQVDNIVTTSARVDGELTFQWGLDFKSWGGNTTVARLSYAAGHLAGQASLEAISTDVAKTGFRIIGVANQTAKALEVMGGDGNVKASISVAGSLKASGGIALGNDTMLTTSTILTSSHYALYFDTTAGDITQDLPNATGMDGCEFVFFKASNDTNILSVGLPDGGNMELSSQGDTVTYRAFNGSWWMKFKAIASS